MCSQRDPSPGGRAAVYIGLFIAFGAFYALGRFVSNRYWKQPQKYVARPAVTSAGQPVSYGSDAGKTNPVVLVSPSV